MIATAVICSTTWVHVFEEDGAAGDVYRPEGGELPLSRRPRQRLSFSPDGSAALVVSGPDDRLQSLTAHWTELESEFLVTPESTAASVQPLHVQVKARDCLLVWR